MKRWLIPNFWTAKYIVYIDSINNFKLIVLYFSINFILIVIHIVLEVFSPTHIQLCTIKKCTILSNVQMLFLLQI